MSIHTEALDGPQPPMTLAEAKGIFQANYNEFATSDPLPVQQKDGSINIIQTFEIKITPGNQLERRERVGRFMLSATMAGLEFNGVSCSDIEPVEGTLMPQTAFIFVVTEKPPELY